MSGRRSHGEGTIFWDERRQGWVASASLGYDAAGKRVRKTAYGRTKTEARAKLREVIRDHEDGLAIAAERYTVEDAVREWFGFGLGKAGERTRETYGYLIDGHIVPKLGFRRLRELKAGEVDAWLADRGKQLSTSSLQKLHSVLNRAVKRAMARDKVKRNVVELCSVPEGKKGRPSKALTFVQAASVLGAVQGSRIEAYIVVSLLTGARTEEMRALTWDHLDLRGRPDDAPPVPPSMSVFRSVRATGDTKTRLSRRQLALPGRCVEVLGRHRAKQAQDRLNAGVRWIDLGLVFTSRYGTPLDSADVRRDFRTAIKKVEGLNEKEWTPRELRHSFVSLLSDDGVPIEEISRLVGHKTTLVTETVYRKQLRPLMQTGATTMDRLFDAGGGPGQPETVGYQFGYQAVPDGEEPDPSEEEPGSELG